MKTTKSKKNNVEFESSNKIINRLKTSKNVNGCVAFQREKNWKDEIEGKKKNKKNR